MAKSAPSPKARSDQKSAFDGPIEIFSYGEILFTDSDRDKLATLTEFDLDYNNIAGTELYKNIFALNCCFFAAELLTKLTDDYDPHPELFDKFMQFLQDIIKQQNNPRIFRY